MRSAIIRYTLVLLLALAASGPRPPILPAEPPNPGGRVEQEDGVLILRLHGDPYEMGLQQGSILCDLLRDLVTEYLYGRILLDRELSGFGLQILVRHLERDIPTALRREMQGIADGAGLPYRDIVLLNAVPELLALTGWMYSCDLSPTLGVEAQDAFASCAEFAAWGWATMDGELVAGHSVVCLDADLLSQYVIVIVRQPSHGNAFASVSLLGLVGVWAGMNEEQIVTTIASSPSGDVASRGQMPSLLLRQVLERAGNLSEAMDIVLAGRRLYGSNVILMDGKAPKAIAIETSAHLHAVFELDGENGVVVRTDHFLDPGLTWIQREFLPDREMIDSEARLAELRALLAPDAGWVGVREELSFLRNDYGSQYEGSAWPDTTASVGTLHRILLYPGKLTIRVARDNSRVAGCSHVNLDLASALLGDP